MTIFFKYENIDMNVEHLMKEEIWEQFREFNVWKNEKAQWSYANTGDIVHCELRTRVAILCMYLPSWIVSRSVLDCCLVRCVMNLWYIAMSTV